MEKKQNKWYAAEYTEYWEIHDNTISEPINILDKDWVGKEEAENNAKLCASAPELLQIAHELYMALENYAPITKQVGEDKYISMNKFEEIWKTVHGQMK